MRRIGVVAGVAMLACLACDSPSRSATRGVRRRPPAAGVAPLLAQADDVYTEAKDSATTLWRVALHLADSTHDSVSMARALTGLSQAARHRGDFSESRTLGERALAFKLRLGMRAELSRSYNTLGLLAWDEGRLRDALELYRRATEAAIAVGDSGGIARASTNTGLAQIDLGEMSEARVSLTRGRDGARAAHDSTNLGRALTNLAVLDIAVGDPLAALATIESARQLAHAQHDSVGEVNAIGQAATAYDALGEPQRAFATLDTAVQKAGRLGLRKEEAEDLKLVGDLFAAAGDHRRALEHFMRATKLTDANALPEERGNLLRAQARSYAALGRSDLATQSLQGALQLHRSGGFLASELSDLILQADFAEVPQGRVEAERIIEAAKQVASRIGGPMAHAQAMLAEARLADRNGDALRVLQVLAAPRPTPEIMDAASAADIAALRLRAYSKLDRLEAAAAAGRQAVAAFERVRGNYDSGELRTSFTSDRASVYADLVLVLLRLRRVDEAFSVADGARGRALLEHISSARSGIRSTSGPARSALEADSLLRAIDALVAQLRENDRTPVRERGTAYTEIARELADRITEARTRYETLAAKDPKGTDAMVLLGTSTRTLADVQASLRPGEVLLEYFVTPLRLVVFVVRHDNVRTLTTNVTADDIVSRTRLARDLIARPDLAGEDLPVMKGLYRVLIQPVMATTDLRDARSLIIVRHSGLTYLPFAALVDSESGRRLSQQFSLLYVPSAATLPALRTPKAMPASQVGGSTVAFAPLPDDLPATRREVQAIVRAIPGAQSVIGRDATERQLRRDLDGGSLIHVATHGVMNSLNPLFSRLELAPSTTSDPSDNGRLETHELLGLHITSRLVFLSGCETGVGEAWSTSFDIGEDYTTLARSFLFAGARNVIATLWRIDDDGAAEFAERFYRALRTLPPPEALARAQNEMLALPRWRNPYFWAAYELVGDGM